MKYAILLGFLLSTANLATAAMKAFMERKLPSGATLAMQFERYDTNANWEVLVQRVLLQRTNAQPLLIWQDQVRAEKPHLSIYERNWKTIYDLFYDEANGIFIMTSERQYSVTVTMVKVPPYPGRYPIEPAPMKLGVDDYAWELKRKNQSYFYGGISRASITQTNEAYYISVQEERDIGRNVVNLYRRTEKGWEQIE